MRRSCTQHRGSGVGTLPSQPQRGKRPSCGLHHPSPHGEGVSGGREPGLGRLSAPHFRRAPIPREELRVALRGYSP